MHNNSLGEWALKLGNRQSFGEAKGGHAESSFTAVIGRSFESSPIQTCSNQRKPASLGEQAGLDGRVLI